MQFIFHRQKRVNRTLPPPAAFQKISKIGSEFRGCILKSKVQSVPQKIVSKLHPVPVFLLLIFICANSHKLQFKKKCLSDSACQNADMWQKVQFKKRYFKCNLNSFPENAHFKFSEFASTGKQNLRSCGEKDKALNFKDKFRFSFPRRSAA